MHLCEEEEKKSIWRYISIIKKNNATILVKFTIFNEQ